MIEPTAPTIPPDFFSASLAFNLCTNFRPALSIQLPKQHSGELLILHDRLKIPQLFPFIKEISDEWLKPRGIHLEKNKSAKNVEKAHLSVCFRQRKIRTS
jgi:hypothetical protein